MWLQGVRGELSAEARSQQTETVVVPGVQGKILDRGGRQLALSEEAATVFATPFQIDDPRTPRSATPRSWPAGDEILDDLRPTPGFAYVVRKVDLSTAEQIRKLKIEGIGQLPDSRRVYPDGELASQVVGAVGLENQGLSGLEAMYDDVLGGTDGEAEVTRDALGETIKRETVKGASTGEDIRLTIDAELQARTEDVLAQVGQTYSPAGATAVVRTRARRRCWRSRTGPPELTDLSSAAPEDLTNLATGSPTSRARPSRRSRSRPRSRRGSSPERCSTCRPRSRSPTARSRSRTSAATSRSASPTSSPSPRTSARSRSGSRSAATASTTGSAARFGRRPGPAPGGGAGSCPRSRTTRARRWATCRSARASR